MAINYTVGSQRQGVVPGTGGTYTDGVIITVEYDTGDTATVDIVASEYADVAHVQGKIKLAAENYAKIAATKGTVG